MTTYPQMVDAKADAVLHSWMLRAELAPPTPGWRLDAECRGCRDFTVDLCATCPSRLDCLRDTWELERHAADIQGIRGGYTANERRAWYKAHPVDPDQQPEPDPIDHGTERGYGQHIRRGDIPACAGCKKAHSIYKWERMKAAAYHKMRVGDKGRADESVDTGTPHAPSGTIQEPPRKVPA